MNTTQSILRRTVLVVVISSLMACGGGSGGGITTVLSDSPTPSTATLQNVNGALEGMYFSTTSLNEGEWLNLNTGEAGAFYEYDDNIPRNLEAVIPSQDGTEYIEVYVDDPAFGDTTSTLLIKDMRTGLVSNEFTVPGEISGSPRTMKFSPDRQTIAARRDLNDDFDYHLSFFTRTGDFIAEFSDESVSEFDWLPDGRFAYFKGGQLHIGELRGPNNISGRSIASLNHLDGTPANLKSSPDGSQFVFEMFTKVPILFESNNYRDATVWRIDNTGDNLEMVATMADTNGSVSESPRVNNPLWSLDGKFLLMSVGVSSSIAIFWEEQYSTVTDDYEPVYITDVITARSQGFMYLLPKDTQDTIFLKEKSYPAIAYNKTGRAQPYEVSSLHIQPGSMLVKAIEPLDETITPVAGGLSGSLIYLKDLGYLDEFDNKLTVMQYDAASRTEHVLFQKSGENYDKSTFFSISKDREYFAHWYSKNYDDKYLKIYDKTGAELESYQLLYVDYPSTLGKNLVSPPQFSPRNPDLLLYRFTDESDVDKSKFGVLNWRTGSYVLLYTGEFSSVTWQEDGSIVASLEKDIYQFTYQNDEFSDPVKLFSTPNKARQLNVSTDQTKIVFTLSGHIFWSYMDGSNLTQVTAPPSTGFEFSPTWSPDGTHIMFTKDEDRYVISADTGNARIDLNKEKNANKTRYITGDGGSVGYWIP